MASAQSPVGGSAGFARKTAMRLLSVSVLGLACCAAVLLLFVSMLTLATCVGVLQAQAHTANCIALLE